MTFQPGPWWHSAAVTWSQSRAQDRGSRKGLLPAGTPTSKASLQAFCMQYCWSSAAAWETCAKGKNKKKKKNNPERKLICSQASIRHFLSKKHCQAELGSSQVSAWSLKCWINQHGHPQSPGEAHTKGRARAEPGKHTGPGCLCHGVHPHGKKTGPWPQDFPFPGADVWTLVSLDHLLKWLLCPNC